MTTKRHSRALRSGIDLLRGMRDLGDDHRRRGRGRRSVQSPRTTHQVPAMMPATATDPAQFERAADQIETVVEIGNLYRRDRFATPAAVWKRVQDAMPDVLSP